MHDAIHSMLDRYDLLTRDAYTNALREIIQEIALLGLWRSKFFEHSMEVLLFGWFTELTATLKIWTSRY